MARLDGHIRAITALIGPGAFVRRDNQGRALFVTDAARTLPDNRLAEVQKRLAQAGYLIRDDKGLLLLDWPQEGYQQFLQQLDSTNSQPANVAPTPHQPEIEGMLAILQRHPGVLTADMLPLFLKALHLWDREQTLPLLRLAGESLAIALRNKKSPPPFFVPLLTNLITPAEKEATGC